MYVYKYLMYLTVFLKRTKVEIYFVDTLLLYVYANNTLVKYQVS